MNNHQSKKIILKIHGMHCASCEVVIERKLRKIAGIERVTVNYTNGKADIYCSREPNLHELQNSIKTDGYTISPWHDRAIATELPHKNTKRDYFQIGAIFLIIVSAYLILKQFDLVPTLGISDNMSYGFVFLIGLVAAMSTCLAVTGGLLLAVAAKYNERFPSLAGVQKLKPHFYFNMGRIVSYTVLGGAVGALGSVLTLSPRATGFMTIAVSIVMIILGFQLLHLFPWMRRFQPKMPKFLAHKIHDLSGKDSKSAPLLLGASTFFLPCGFTQALQLYVLAKGDPVTGALTMLAFSLGTLPALMSLSAISSFAKGAFQKHFLKFAGVAVIMLGFFNINNGIALTGSNFSLASVLWASDNNTNQQEELSAEIIDGKQLVNMQVAGLSYSPHQFTVAQGIPVEWRIDGSQAEGCAQVISVPKLGIVKYLSSGAPTVITFTPQELGTIGFSCTMGMTTRGSSFKVVPNITGIAGAKIEEQPLENTSECNPEFTNCIETQKVSIEVSRERGIYPRSVTIKKGVPVDLSIDAKIPLGGCTSVWVIPQYDVTIPIKIGMNRASFTPTKTGTLSMTCSMGGRMAQFEVIN